MPTPGDSSSSRGLRAPADGYVPRSLASAVGPMIAGYLFLLSGFGWPLLIGGP
jgi:hypothetical protein